jgi:uncharacterized protein (DUF2141 family)
LSKIITTGNNIKDEKRTGKTVRNIAKVFFTLHFSLLILTVLLSACARMGAPDGGWYDETPPRVIGASPEDRETGVTQKHISIYFNEYIKIENVSEKVVISPPQMEQPEIKTQGKRIAINLIDSLKPNTTYTIDFSDAISDNNEGNPMGNYTYSFSTGEDIDTMECSGYVLNAEDLEPVKGILVGLVDTAKSDTAQTLLRVSRTDSRGHFVIRGIAPGTYCVCAIEDVDGDYRFSQRSEMMAFSHDRITPSHFLDHRQDTLWLDELHIKDIKRVPYTHFMPDNIVLRAFMHEQTDRHFIKFDRTDADHFTLFFSAPISSDSLKRFADSGIATLPSLRLLDTDATIDQRDIEYSSKGDTITYWLRDTTLINTDTLLVEMVTLQTDTANTLQITKDTLEVLPKTSYAKRMKKLKEEQDEWNKNIEKKLKEREKQLERMRRAGEEDFSSLPEIDTLMPPVRLLPKYDIKQQISPDENIRISFPYPMARVDTSAVHLYVEQDSMWFRSPMTLHTTDSLPTQRNWEVYTEWIPGAKYSFEVDSAAFEDIYGHVAEAYKTGIVVANLEDYASLFVNISPLPTDSSDIIVQLIDKGDKPVRTVVAKGGTAEFYYIAAGSYYMRAIIDRNHNGVWDTGDYYNDIQPEEVYYYNELIECKAKWDYTKQWQLTSRPLYKQKPEQITKQKGEKKKTIKNRNADRAKELGVTPPEK